MIIESQIVVVIAIFINMKHGKDNNSGWSKFNYVMSALLAFIYIPFPLIVSSLLCWNFKELNNVSKKQSFGVLYEGQRFKHKSIIFYNSLFFARASIIAYSVVIWNQHLPLQLMALYLTSFGIIGFNYAFRTVSFSERRQLVSEELTLICLSYFFLCFSTLNGN